MSEPDKRATASEYADALRGVMDRASEMESVAKTRQSARQAILSRPGVVVGVTIPFVLVVAYNLYSVTRSPLEVPADMVEETAQTSTLLAAALIESYREENGVLPASLTDIGLPEDQFVYVIADDGSFFLEPRLGDSELLYDSRVGPQSVGDGSVPPGGIEQ